MHDGINEKEKCYFESPENKTIEFTIYICQPFHRIKHIKLNKNSSISILNDIYPKDSLYIYSGQILDISRSFVYYNIKKDNKIVLIPSNMKKRNPNFIDKWLKLTNDKEQFEDMVNIKMKKTSRSELARLRDIKCMKNELKQKRFCLKHKLLNEQSFGIEKQFYVNNKEEEQLNVEYDLSTTPSVDPLPIIW